MSIKKNPIALTLWKIKPYIFNCNDSPLIICHFTVVAKYVAQRLCLLTFFLVNKLKSLP